MTYQMRILAWIIAIPFALLATVFAAANRQLVPLDLWPLPGTQEIPAYLLVLVPLLIGTLVGASLTWTSGLRFRLRARTQRRRADELEANLANIRAKAEKSPVTAPGPDKTTPLLSGPAA